MNPASGETLRVEGVPWWVVVGGLGALIAYPLVFTMPFHQHIVIMALLYGTLGTAWNILGGYTGQVSIGHGVYYGIGAYTAAYFYVNFGLSPWVSWPLALMIAFVAAFVIGLPTFRLRGHYFVLASVFIAEAVYIIISNWDMVGGAIGLEYPIHRAESSLDALWHLQFHKSKLPYYYGILTLFVASVFVSWRIRFRPLGYFLKAVSEEQDAARSLGVDIARYKMVALLISVLFTTLCGMFYAQYVMYVEPVNTMSLIVSLEIAFIAIFGGIKTLWGPVLGAFIIIPVTEFLRANFSGHIALDQSALAEGGIGAWVDYYMAGGGGNVDLLVYGLLIIIIARFQPNGVIGFFHRFD
jgi:branched-chain amino acid transport system permease protein